MSLRYGNVYRMTQVPRSRRKRNGARFPIARKKPKKSITPREVVDDFGHDTTLLGIQHILKKRSIVWTFAYVCCVAMSVFQSWSVTLDFIERKTHQKFSVLNAEELRFPSVTVCNGVVLPTDFNLSLIPGYDTSIKDIVLDEVCTIEDELHKWEETAQSNMKAILKYRKNLSEEMRMELSGPVESFISMCKFDGKPCGSFNDTNKFFIFNNPFYGTCLTFNPSFDEASSLMADVNAKLFLEFHFRKNVRQLETTRPSAGIQINTPGAAPLLESAYMQDVYEKETVVLKLQENIKEFQSRPQADSLTCIDASDPKYMKKSLFYSEKSPYTYSVRACMRSCDDQLLRKWCKVSLASGPVPHDDNQRRKDAKAYGVYLPTDDCHIPEKMDMKACDCPLPCRYTEYKEIVDYTDTLSPQCGDYNGTKTKQINKANVMVYFLNNMYEIVQEEVTINLTQYLGILGGNLSLWIGVCIISLLELIELSFNLLRAYIYNRHSSLHQPFDNQRGYYPSANEIPTLKNTSRIRQEPIYYKPF